MTTYTITFGFIVFDVLTGFLKALHQKNLNSTILREGLFHKMSEILAVTGSGLLEYVCAYMNLGVELPLLTVVSVYICTMELVSCIENLSEVNPHLQKLFQPYLEKLNNK